jgi:hypothetical protein
MSTSVDILARFFGAALSQGLSGGAAAPVDANAAGSPLAARLRRHRHAAGKAPTAADLWAHGLLDHLRTERPDGICWTDVVLVLAPSDAPDAEGRSALENDLAERHAAWARSERLPLRRAARVRVLIDQDPDAPAAPSLGLSPGEFVTALSPTVHIGGGDTAPTLVIHACIPAEGDGYRELGRLHDDQLLFTAGSHWLDTFRHPSLPAPCAWVLHRKPDGTTVHQVCPSLQHLLATHAHLDPETGVNVVTLATRSGEPLLHVVLVDVEPPADMTRPRVRKVNRASSRTVVPDDVGVRALTLHERGALLQKVHFAAFMEGYDVHIGDGGTIATRMDAPRATLRVRGSDVALVAHVTGVTFDGIPVPVSAPVPLDGPIRIGVDGHDFAWRPLTDVALEGWPYLAEVRRQGGGATLPFGAHHRIGRDRRCAVRLPDEPWNGNIAWKPSVGSGAVIRSRSGEIPKSKFYIDSIMVASEHAEIDLSPVDGSVSGVRAMGSAPTCTPMLRSLARQCYTFLRRAGELRALQPREGARQPTECELLPGDEILVGNCLYEVQYAAEESAPPAAPPVLTMDVPVAFALGEKGPPPRSVLAPEEVLGAVSPLDTPEPRGVPGGARERGTPAETPAPRAHVAVPDEVATVMLATPEGPPDPLPPELPTLEGDVLTVTPQEIAAEGSGVVRLVLEGWRIGEELLVGNNAGSGAPVPEILTTPDASFLPMDGVALHGGADGVRAEVLASGEAAILIDGHEVERAEDARGARLRIVRRDANYEPLLEVGLHIVAHPESGFLLVPDDPCAAGLGVRSFPLGQWRRTRAGATPLAGYWDGGALHLREIGGPTDIVAERSKDGTWIDRPERACVLVPGERLRIGSALWRLDAGRAP